MAVVESVQTLFFTYNVKSLQFCTVLACPAAGSAIIYSAYVFPDKWVNSFFHQCYIPIAVFNTVICTCLACYSRYGEKIHFTQLILNLNQWWKVTKYIYLLYLSISIFCTLLCYISEGHIVLFTPLHLFDNLSN